MEHWKQPNRGGFLRPAVTEVRLGRCAWPRLLLRLMVLPFLVSWGDWSSLRALYEPRYALYWVKRTDVGSPGPRYGHGMVYDSKRGVTVFFGGEFSEIGGAPEYYGDTWEYDGVSWKPIRIDGPSPSPRSRHAMCYDSWHHQVMLFGGKGNAGTSNDLWAYESTGPQQGKWTLQKPPAGGVLPMALSATAMAFDDSTGLIHVAGGTPDPSVSGFPYTRNAWTWDTTLFRWELDKVRIGYGAAGRGSGLTSHTMIFDEKRKWILAFGGYGPFGLYIQANHRIWHLNSLEGTELGTLSGYVDGATVHNTRHDIYFEFGGLDFDAGQIKEGQGSPGLENVLYPQFDRFNEGYDPTRISVWMDNGFPELRPEPRTQLAMVYDKKRDVTVLFGGVGGARFRDTWELLTWDRQDVWLDFANDGYVLGNALAPYNQLRDAVGIVITNGVIHIRGGASPSGAFLTKPMKLTAYDGPVVLGRKQP